jgi:DNA repair protein RecN (Recombination protein N)
MLLEIRVRNFAVIDAVTASFGPGLNVLTGETGAGKSMLLDAILLIRGARAQTDVIRTDTETATVEALFEVGPRSPVESVLDEAGLGLDQGQLVIRRELARSGRHRAFVNDSPVTVGLLERLGDHLVEIHGQHEHQRLLEPSRQLDLLDRFADTDELRDRVGDLFAKHRAAGAELERARAAERDRVQREDLLRLQVSELDAARLRAGEEEELRVERRRLQHAERLSAGLAEAAGLLNDDDSSAMSRLHRTARLLRDLARLDPAFAAPADSVDGAGALVEDALAAVRSLRESVVMAPGRLEAIDERLDAITRLKRKYGDTETAMLAFRDAAAIELERLGRHERSWPSRSACSASSRQSFRGPRTSSRSAGTTPPSGSPATRRASCASSAWSAPASRSRLGGRRSRRSERVGSTGSSSGCRRTPARTCGRSRGSRRAASSRTMLLAGRFWPAPIECPP